jgi:hypothetical protein
VESSEERQSEGTERIANYSITRGFNDSFTFFGSGPYNTYRIKEFPEHAALWPDPTAWGPDQRVGRAPGGHRYAAGALFRQNKKAERK